MKICFMSCLITQYHALSTCYFHTDSWLRLLPSLHTPSLYISCSNHNHHHDLVPPFLPTQPPATGIHYAHILLMKQSIMLKKKKGEGRNGAKVKRFWNKTKGDRISAKSDLYISIEHGGACKSFDSSSCYFHLCCFREEISTAMNESMFS